MLDQNNQEILELKKDLVGETITLSSLQRYSLFLCLPNQNDILYFIHNSDFDSLSFFFPSKKLFYAFETSP